MKINIIAITDLEHSSPRILNLLYHLDSKKYNKYIIAANYDNFLSKTKFDVNSYYIDEQPGNFRETIRINNDCKEELGWNLQDILPNYINNL